MYNVMIVIETVLIQSNEKMTNVYYPLMNSDIIIKENIFISKYNTGETPFMQYVDFFKAIV